MNCIDDLNSLKTFGYHGESLCNIIRLSDQFDLISRSKDSKEHCFYQKKFITNKLEQPIQKLSYQNKNFANIATIVRVKNLFGQHALRQQQLKGVLGKQISCLLKKIETIALIHFYIEIVVVDSKEKKALFHSKKHANLKEKFLSFFNESNHQFIKDFQLKKNNYQIDGLVSLIGKDHQLFSSSFQSAKLHLVYINSKHFVENKTIHDYVAKQLSSCHIFNLLKAEPKHMVFCISISCPFTEYTWTKIGQNFMIEFKNQSILNILENFINLFLIKYEFKKMIENKLIASEDRMKNNSTHYDLKDVRVSKLVTNQAYRRENVLKAVKNVTEIEKKQELLKENKKLTFSGLRSAVKRNYSKKYANKSTQTQITSGLRKKKIKPVRLLPNWIVHKNALGVVFYLNTIDGSTTYDLNQVKLVEIDDSMFDRVIKNQNNQNKLDNMRYMLRNFESDRDKVFENDFENKIINKQSTDLNALLEEKMILVKWRNREDLIKQQKIKNSNSCVNNFSNIGNLKLDRSLFDQLKVRKKIKFSKLIVILI